MSPPRILISGASIAGPALAYWLARASCTVTIVERAPTLRRAGQGVDVRDSARDVIRRMGIFDTLCDRSSKEEGIRLVDANNKSLASFGVDLESGKGDSPTCDIEILRGELAGILHDVTERDVEYIFGDSIDALNEANDEVNVTFSSGKTRPFDLVIAADGLGSHTRTLAFGKDAIEIRSLNAYVSYFSLRPSATDSMWARVHWSPGGRNIALRPDNIGRTRAFMTMVAYSSSDERLPHFAKAYKQGVDAQKAVTREIFQDADWEAPRLLEAMQEADDFYMQHVAQARLKNWSTPSGRVTVVGDAGYAPSPFTGMGTSLAFIGAYVLAGEISKNLDDLPAAVRSYEQVLKPYVEKVQKLAPGIPWILNPQSKAGVKILENIAKVVQIIKSTLIATALLKVGSWLPVGNGDFPLPEYEAFKEHKAES